MKGRKPSLAVSHFDYKQLGFCLGCLMFSFVGTALIKLKDVHVDRTVLCANVETVFFTRS